MTRRTADHEEYFWTLYAVDKRHPIGRRIDLLFFSPDTGTRFKAGVALLDKTQGQLSQKYKADQTDEAFLKRERVRLTQAFDQLNAETHFSLYNCRKAIERGNELLIQSELVKLRAVVGAYLGLTTSIEVPNMKTASQYLPQPLVRQLHKSMRAPVGKGFLNLLAVLDHVIAAAAKFLGVSPLVGAPFGATRTRWAEPSAKNPRMLEQIVRMLERKYSPQVIFLAGSRATESFRDASDWDFHLFVRQRVARVGSLFAASRSI